ncbi:S1C family serine protease [Leptospira sp. GIMC2001]|uniref:S1C family serine protease n=1 Tax=Leptospira sp. GIMC2001 TaxID=1513297 RepID=UPI00234AD951|nr:trypsin-like peptidase domain-containing protein [Leptospira sp. GIMC2001]WCL50260.1 trypsin-like peptidase domain-containing protein [Leptospira sp. GIMC2001]
MIQNRKIPRIVYLNLILLFLVLGVIFFPEIRDSLGHLTASTKPIAPRKQMQAVQLQNSFRSVYQIAQKSVVSIRTKKTETIHNPYHYFDSKEETVSAVGSGFLIDPRGFVVTNYHVIRSAEIIEIILHNGRVAPARFVGSHERADIALLKIQEGDDYEYASLGDSNEVEVGDWAIAVGSPYGLEKTFTVGVVSAKSREDLDETGQTHIQTDTAINPGSSGGPLLNIYGEVIGINRMIRSASGSSAGIGFAIPINYAKKVIKSIEMNVGKNIRPATLGVVATVPIQHHREALGIPNNEVGVLVYDIDPDSSAALGGLQRFDYIRMANGNVIRNTNELREQVSLAGLGGNLKLNIIRRSKIKDIEITLIEKKYYE